MCGICGVVYHDERLVSNELIQNMSETLRHRGPNAAGIHVRGNVGLGHTRLAVIDVSERGNQPMHTGHGHSLVFNGEIYNFAELRKKLSSKCTFTSRTDSEVLLHGLALYGIDFIEHLEGMFAFAFWDTNTQTLLLARDRMGQKPLYYAELDNCFIFASEPHAILKHPDFTPEPDLNTLFHYLSVQSCPAPMSAYKNMFKIGPGEVLKLNNGKITKWAYWSPKFSEHCQISEEDAVDNLVKCLRDSISKCLVSDVPLGLFLSGGVDSSLVAAIAADISEQQLKTFTIGFSNVEYDERKYARLLADHCGLDHHELVVEPSLDIVDTIIERYAEPFADSSALPTYYLSKFTKEHVTVALSGDGGDDLFAGYERHLNPFLYPAVPSLPQHRRDEFLRDLPYVSGRKIKDPKAEQREYKLGPGLFFYYRYWARFYGLRKQQLCTNEFAKQAIPPLSVDLFLNREDFDSCSALNNIIGFELKYYLASTLMPKVDIMSMSHSLEVRAPLLEPAVVDFACTLPEHLKVRQNSDTVMDGEPYTAKYLLKKAAERFIPHELIYRPKMGFGVPIGHWMRNEYKELLCDSLLSSKAKNRGYFNIIFVENLISRHIKGENLQYPLWTLLMLELWHQKYIDV